jgi:hypothetical protein
MLILRQARNFTENRVSQSAFLQASSFDPICGLMGVTPYEMPVLSKRKGLKSALMGVQG